MANPKVQFDILADTSNFKKGMSDADKASSKLHQTLDKFGPVGRGVANVLDKLGFSSVGAAAGVGATVAALGVAAKVAEDAISQYVNLGDQVRHYSQVSGESAEASSREVIAFKELGLDAETVAAGMFRLGKNVETAGAKLAGLGIEVAHNVDGSTNLNGTLLNVMRAYQTTGDAAKRDAIIFAAFGRAGAAMIPVLEANSAELARLEAQVQSIYTQKDLDEIRNYQIAQKELKQSTDDLGLSIGRALLPVQKGMVDNINENIYVNQHLSDSIEYQQGVQSHNRIATMQAAQALREQYRASLDARTAADSLAQSQVDAAKAAKAEADAEDTLYSAIHKNIDASFAYRQSVFDLTNATKAASAAKGQDAELNLREQEAYVKVADAAVALAEQQAEVAGKTLSASEKAEIWKAKLQELEKQLGPNANLRKVLQGYIDEVNAIPSEKTTSLNLRFQGINARAGGNIGQFAEGGTVPGPTGAPQLAVVHGGEEVIPAGGRGRENHIHIHVDQGAYIDGPSIDRLANLILQRARFAPGT